MHLILVACVFVPLLLSIYCHENYCNHKLCDKGVKHVACNAEEAFTSTCPKNGEAHLVPMDAELQSQIVDTHNHYRSHVAFGNLKGFEPASNMSQMKWDANLAYVASFNVRGCIMKHDDCRATAAYPNSGQNLAYWGKTRSYLNDKDAIGKMIDMWFQEYKDANMSVIEAYHRSKTGAMYGHFTALMQQRSGHVGCAMAKYRDDTLYNTLMACNYESTNILGQPVYASGPVCSKCNGHCGTNGLCHH